MTKYIHDSIHKQVALEPRLLKLVNTFPFQRLHYIKQLSVTYHVFPTAKHTRFEHSVGVCHLAGKLMRSLRNKQPELNITDDDILTLELAGLCHDLGHGPFSHTFDKFIESLNLTSLDNPYLIHHEYRSCVIMEHIISKYNIDLGHVIEGAKDLIFPIKKNINKPFMYQIVANSKSGIDVDKFDYIKRDTYNLGLEYSIDIDTLLEMARIIDGNVCYPDKSLFSIYNIFECRGRLHREIYNNPVSNGIELMVHDLFASLRDTFDWVKYITDIELFMTLNDSLILYSASDSVETRQIKSNILERKLYRYVGNIMIPYEMVNDIDDIIKDFNYENKGVFDDVIVKKVYIGYRENPVFDVHLYKIKNPTKSFRIKQRDISPLLPTVFEDCFLQVYVREKDMSSIGEYYITELQKFIEN